MNDYEYKQDKEFYIQAIKYNDDFCLKYYRGINTVHESNGSPCVKTLINRQFTEFVSNNKQKTDKNNWYSFKYIDTITEQMRIYRIEREKNKINQLDSNKKELSFSCNEMEKREKEAEEKIISDFSTINNRFIEFQFNENYNLIEKDSLDIIEEQGRSILFIKNNKKFVAFKQDLELLYYNTIKKELALKANIILPDVSQQIGYIGNTTLAGRKHLVDDWINRITIESEDEELKKLYENLIRIYLQYHFQSSYLECAFLLQANINFWKEIGKNIQNMAFYKQSIEECASQLPLPKESKITIKDIIPYFSFFNNSFEGVFENTCAVFPVVMLFVMMFAMSGNIGEAGITINALKPMMAGVFGVFIKLIHDGYFEHPKNKIIKNKGGN